MNGTGRRHVEEALQRIEALVGSLDQLQDPRARTMARDLVEAVLDLHGLALAKLAAGLSATKEGARVFEGLAEDDEIRALLLLHGLHPEGPESRIRKALDALRPRLAAQGAHAQLIAVSDGVARLGLHAAGAGPGEIAMLKRDIEAAVADAAPDIEEVVIAGEAGSRSPVALAS